MELMDREACYRAFQSHDARFDGRIFVGVTSTGIYFRPICPARPPKFENCRFFASAAGAQEAGFRPCLRCRPEIAPELAFWRGSSNTVSRALKLIAEGALDEHRHGPCGGSAEHGGAEEFTAGFHDRMVLAKLIIGSAEHEVAELGGFLVGEDDTLLGVGVFDKRTSRLVGNRSLEETEDE